MPSTTHIFEQKKSLNKIIRLSSSDMGETELEAVQRVFSSNHLGMGEEVRLFEKEIEEFLKGRLIEDQIDVEKDNTTFNVVAVDHCTNAIHLSLLGMNIKSGDEVLVPTITYVATFQAISATGAKPIPCDVDQNGLIDLESAQKNMSSKTKALVYVHYASQFHNRSAVYAFTKKYGLRVLEDAAHSFGSHYEKENFDVICFSFGNIKNITCGEGGAIVTKDPNILNFARDARLLAVEHDTDNRYLKKRSWIFDVKHQGYRYHMSNLSACIGRAQLKRFNELHVQRRAIVQLYFKKLALYHEFEKITLFPLNKNFISPHIFPILIKNRDELRKYLIEKGIETGTHYYPNHRLSFYKSNDNFKNADFFYDHIVTLPLHSRLTDDHVNFVTDSLVNYIKLEKL